MPALRTGEYQSFRDLMHGCVGFSRSWAYGPHSNTGSGPHVRPPRTGLILTELTKHELNVGVFIVFSKMDAQRVPFPIRTVVIVHSIHGA